MSIAPSGDANHTFQSLGATHPAVVDGGFVEIPSASWLLGTEFVHSGPDLQLLGADGHTVLVRDFFTLENPPGLKTEGGQTITAEQVVKMAGPQVLAQVAQAGPVEAAVGEPIGTVETLEGKVDATRVDGAKVVLQQGDPVFQGDALATGPEGAVGIVFVDESVFSLGPEGSMTLDEMVYDAGEQTGTASVSLLSGALTFVSGQIAKTSPEGMIITTPTATVGIRGSAGGVSHNPKTGLSKGVLFQEKGGFSGELNMTVGNNTVTINQPFQSSSATRSGKLTPPKDMSMQEIGAKFGSAMKSMPNAADHLPDTFRNEVDQVVQQIQADPQAAEEAAQAEEEEAAQAEAEAVQAEEEAAQAEAEAEAEAAAEEEAAAAEAEAQAEAEAEAAAAEAEAQAEAEAEAAAAEEEAALVEEEVVQVLEEGGFPEDPGDPGGPGGPGDPEGPGGHDIFDNIFDTGGIFDGSGGFDTGGDIFGNVDMLGNDLTPGIDDYIPDYTELLSDTTEGGAEIFNLYGLEDLLDVGHHDTVYDDYVQKEVVSVFADVKTATSGSDDLRGGDGNTNFYFAHNQGSGSAIGGADVITDAGGTNQMSFDGLNNIKMQFLMSGPDSGDVTIWSGFNADPGNDTAISTIDFTRITQYLFSDTAVSTFSSGYAAQSGEDLSGAATIPDDEDHGDIIVMPGLEEAGLYGYAVVGTDSSETITLSSTLTPGMDNAIVFGKGGLDVFDISGYGYRLLIGGDNSDNTYDYSNTYIDTEGGQGANDVGLAVALLGDVALVAENGNPYGSRIRDMLWNVGIFKGSPATDNITVTSGTFRSIEGGGGKDTIGSVDWGFTYIDSVNGGGGADTFNLNTEWKNKYTYTAVTDSYYDSGDTTDYGRDTINYFKSSGDTIDISSLVSASAITNLNTGAILDKGASLNFASLTTANFFDDSGTDRTIAVGSDGANARVYVDVNGNGNLDAGTDMEIILTGYANTSGISAEYDFVISPLKAVASQKISGADSTTLVLTGSALGTVTVDMSDSTSYGGEAVKDSGLTVIITAPVDPLTGVGQAGWYVYGSTVNVDASAISAATTITAAPGLGATFTTGSGATTIQGTGTAVTVNAAALADDTALTLASSTSSDYTITGLKGDLVASTATGILDVTTVNAGGAIDVTAGIGALTLTAADAAADTIAIDAVDLTASLTLSGGSTSTINVTNFKSSGTLNASAVTGTFSVTSIMADVTITGGSGANTYTFNNGTFTSLDTVTGGAAADVLNINAIADGTTLAAGTTNVETFNLSLAGNATFNGLGDTGATTINVDQVLTGKTLTLTGLVSTVVTVDATTGGQIAGGINATFSNTADVTVTGGAEANTYTMGSTLSDGDSLTGGAAADSLTATLGASSVAPTITNVEAIGLTMSGAGAINAANISGSGSTITLTGGGAGTTAVTNLSVGLNASDFAAGENVTIGLVGTSTIQDVALVGAAGGTATATATLGNNIGVASTLTTDANVDSLTLTLDDTASSSHAIDMGGINAATTVTAVSAGSNANTLTITLGTSGAHLLNLSGVNASTSIVISSGSGTGWADFLSDTAAVVADVDGSGLGAGESMDIKGGAGTQTLKGGGGQDDLQGGAGADILTGNGDNDTYHYDASTEGGDTITDYLTGTDKLNFDTAFGLGASKSYALSGAVADGDNVILNTAAAVADAAGIQTNIDGYSGTLTTNNTVLYTAFNTNTSKAEVWYDGDVDAAGGAVLMATLDDVTTLTLLQNNFDTTDFTITV